MLTRR